MLERLNHTTKARHIWKSALCSLLLVRNSCKVCSGIVNAYKIFLGSCDRTLTLNV